MANISTMEQHEKLNEENNSIEDKYNTLLQAERKEDKGQSRTREGMCNHIAYKRSMLAVWVCLSFSWVPH